MNNSNGARAPFLALGLVLSLVLSGCRVPIVQTQIDDTLGLPQDHGLVVVQVVSNALHIDFEINGWETLYAVNSNDPALEYALKRVDGGFTTSDFFIGALPEGLYSFSEIVSEVRYMGDSSYWITLPVTQSLGSFRVSSNQITSLGTLIYQPLGRYRREDGSIASPFTLQRFKEFESLEDQVPVLYPRLAQTLDGGVILGWDGQRIEDAESRTVESIIAAAMPSTTTWVDGEGPVVFSRLGQMFKRNSGSGEWLRADTGNSHQLTAITRTGSGWLAGGERGLLLAATDWTDSWSRIEGPGLDQAIVWLHATYAGDVFAVSTTDGAVSLLRKGAESESWQTLSRQGVKGSTRPFRGSRIFHASVDSEQIVFIVDGERRVFSFGGDLISEEDTLDFVDAAQQADDILVADSSLTSTRVSHSMDYGASWEERRARINLERPWYRETELPIMGPEGTEFQIVRKGEIVGSRTQGIDYTEEPWLREYFPDTRRIIWHAEIDPMCVELLPSISTSSEMYVLCWNGIIQRSIDQGDSWEDELVPGDLEPFPDPVIEGSDEFVTQNLRG